MQLQSYLLLVKCTVDYQNKILPITLILKVKIKNIVQTYFQMIIVYAQIKK